MASPQGMVELQKYMAAPADSTLNVLLSPAQIDSVANLISKYAGQAIPTQQMCIRDRGFNLQNCRNGCFRDLLRENPAFC